MGELSEMAEKISSFEKRTGTDYKRQNLENKTAIVPVKKQYHKADKPSQAPLGRNIKLQGEAKNDYLNNLASCMRNLQRPSESLDSIYSQRDIERLKDTTTRDAYLWLNKKYPFSKHRTDFTQNIRELISVLKEKPQIEISLATGMPASAMLLAISNTSKHID
ncbi:MAG: hypothetical protein KAS15_01950, partial [Nanoarchaeota archaeon]|nr:hypothetical protein [Nanoarchaeota archaeon]